MRFLLAYMSLGVVSAMAEASVCDLECAIEGQRCAEGSVGLVSSKFCRIQYGKGTDNYRAFRTLACLKMTMGMSVVGH